MQKYYKLSLANKIINEHFNMFDRFYSDFENWSFEEKKIHYVISRMCDQYPDSYFFIFGLLAKNLSLKEAFEEINKKEYYKKIVDTIQEKFSTKSQEELEVIIADYVRDSGLDYPKTWLNFGEAGSSRALNPYFLLKTILEVINENSANIEHRSIENEVIYNSFLRLTSAWDHKLHGINPPVKTTGTFMKFICILPYIKKLGATIISLLPLTSIGEYGKKGTHGSAYAIKNHYDIDNSLASNYLAISNVAYQTNFFIEAAHALGLKVVCEFIFRTVSIDSPLALDHPEWFYWINANLETHYKKPEYTAEQLKQIKENIEKGDYSNSIAPSEQYKSLFTEPPIKTWLENGKVFGQTANGLRVTLPTAFADWPPDDNQPLWNDVTYLKFYNHPDYNYIAYNTIRYYDQELLDNPQYFQEDLKQYLLDIVPYWIDNFSIDGIMLDMGHALPDFLRKEIIDTAKAKKESFICFEENFVPNIKSKEEGFDAIVGYLIFDMMKCEKMKGFIRRLESEKLDIPMFATPENHNTPRVQFKVDNPEFSKLMYCISSFLPQTVRFIHSGFELLESHPVNTGLEFSDEEIAQFSADNLGLFSFNSFAWDINISEFIASINALRDELIGDEISSYIVSYIDNSAKECLTYTLTIDEKTILICANYSPEVEYVRINLKNEYKNFKNSITNANFEVQNQTLALTLKGYEFAIGILTK